MNLTRMISIMENGLTELKEMLECNNDSQALKEYVLVREGELRCFKELVGKLEGDTISSGVETYLMTMGADKKYVGMSRDPHNHFQITPKLELLMSVGY